MLVKVIFVCSSTLLLIFLYGYGTFTNLHQETVVPKALEEAFNTKYSTNIPRIWQKHYYGYKAIFIKDSIKYEAEFLTNGKWVETERIVSRKEFPDIVLQKIKKKYPRFIITKYEIEITSKGLFYEVDITDGEIEDELYFDEKGNFAVDLYED